MPIYAADDASVRTACRKRMACPSNSSSSWQDDFFFFLLAALGIADGRLFVLAPCLVSPEVN